jgi:hypothetical protein
MANVPQAYDKCIVSVRGRILAEQTRVQVQAVDSDEQVDLLEAGGEFPAVANIPSVRRIVLSFDLVVPVDNPEDLELWDDYQTSERVPIAAQLQGSGKTLSTTGVIRQPTIESRVNGTTTLVVSALCDFATFK